MDKSLLIIDDDDTLRYSMVRALKRHIGEIFEASEGTSAQQVLSQNTIDWVLLDLKLGSESGLDLAKQLLKQKPDLTIVMITGYASISTAVEAIKFGVHDYLTKPVSRDDILQAFGSSSSQSAVISDKPMSPKRLEWEHIQKVLKDHDGNISQAAKALNMHRRTLQRKLQKKPVKE